MKTVPLEDAQSTLPELLDQVANGEDVAIERGDGSSFRIVPVLKERILGLHPGAFEILDGFDDPIAEFFETPDSDPLKDMEPDS
ncbi:MAG: prevent-host-death protein [Bacteroidota bacterium]